MGTAVAQWLRFCATKRKVAGSIPDGVTGFFRWHNRSDSTIALGYSQPLTEMSTWSISWGKCGRRVRLTLPPSCAVVRKPGNLNFLEPPGPLQACNGTALPLRRNKQDYSSCPWQHNVDDSDKFQLSKNETKLQIQIQRTHTNNNTI
jgi:hypothetical protein